MFPASGSILPARPRACPMQWSGEDPIEVEIQRSKPRPQSQRPLLGSTPPPSPPRPTTPPTPTPSLRSSPPRPARLRPLPGSTDVFRFQLQRILFLLVALAATGPLKCTMALAAVTPAAAAPPGTVPALRLGTARLFNQGNDLRLTVAAPDTNLVYEVQTTPLLSSSSIWSSAQLGLPGQTNFILRPGGAHPGRSAFYRLHLPPLAAPRHVQAEEDVPVSLPALRLQLTGTNAALLEFSATNGWLEVPSFGPTRVPPSSQWSILSNHSSHLALGGTLDALQAALPGIRYQSHSNFFGPDTLTVSLTLPSPHHRSVGPLDQIRLSIDVNPINDPPEAAPDRFSGTQDSSLLVPAPGVLANDSDVESDPLTARLSTPPRQGQVTLGLDGSFVYLPEPGFAGEERFYYRASDGRAESPDTEVRILVSPPVDSPAIRLLQPTNEATVTVGRGIELKAEVIPATAPVDRVEYYTERGGLRLGTVFAAPYSFSWTPPRAGRHDLTAQAWDQAGRRGLTQPIWITVEKDCDGDGISDLAEARQGTDPCDFFDDRPPLLRIVEGNFQSGPAGTALPRPLGVRVTNLQGLPADTLLIRFLVVEGDPGLAGQGAATTEWSSSLTSTTDKNGEAFLQARTPSTQGRIGLVQVSIVAHPEVSPLLFALSAPGPQQAWTVATRTRAVATGAAHALALRSDGSIHAWGDNHAGQLGDGIDPSAVPFSSTPLRVPGISNAIAIAAGSWHSLAVMEDGTVRAWGEYREHFRPTPPGNLARVLAVAGGEGHSLALLQDGTVRAWGDPFTNFTPPAGLASVAALAAGRNFSLALRGDGGVTAWGLSGNQEDVGQLRVPAGLREVQAIAAGGTHGLALRRDGTVVGWGGNEFGQATPPATLEAVVGIAAGESHSLAWLANGSVVVWGKTPVGNPGLLPS